MMMNDDCAFHTGCYSKIGRALFSTLLDFSRAERSDPGKNTFSIFTIDGHQIESENYFFANVDHGMMSVVRGMDNEILLIPYNCRKMPKDEADSLKDKISKSLTWLIDACCMNKKDEDLPFLIVNSRCRVYPLDKYLKSEKSIYESITLDEIRMTGEYFTIRKLGEILDGSKEGIEDDPFRLNAKDQLRKLLYERINDVDKFMRERLESIDDKASCTLLMFVNILFALDIIPFLRSSNRISLADYYRFRLKSYNEPDDVRVKVLEVIEELETQPAYLELTKIIDDIEVLTPIRSMISDLSVTLV